MGLRGSGREWMLRKVGTWGRGSGREMCVEEGWDLGGAGVGEGGWGGKLVLRGLDLACMSAYLGGGLGVEGLGVGVVGLWVRLEGLGSGWRGWGSG